MDDARETRCPACGSRLDGAQRCGGCGLTLGGAEATELRTLEARLRALDHQLGDLATRRAGVAEELGRARLAIRLRDEPVARPVPTPSADPFGRGQFPWAESRREVSPERVRNVMLWLGTTLLACSALTFTAVAWTRLDDRGRAVLLAGVTIIAVVLALAARRRLPATAEALSGLAIALALIDWYALRRGGLAEGISDTAWWAVGTATVGLFAAGIGARTGPRTARVAIAILGPVSATLVVATVAGAAWSIACGLALLSGGLVVIASLLAGRVGEHRLVGLVHVEAGALWISAAIAAGIASAQPTSFAATIIPAIAVVALACAPVAVVVARRARSGIRVTAAAVASASPVGACVTLLSTSFGVDGLLAAAAVLAVAEVAVAGWVPRPWRQGAVAAGVAALVPGLVAASPGAMTAWAAPTGWFRDAWAGDADVSARDVFAGADTSWIFPVGVSAVVVLLAAGAAALVAGTALGHRQRVVRAGPALVLSVIFAVAGVLVAPIVGGASARVACWVATTATCALIVGTAAIARKRPTLASRAGALAALPAVSAAGWAAMTPTASVVALTAVLGTAAIATVVGRAEPLRTLHLAIAGASAVALAGIGSAAAGYGAGPAGFTAAVVAVVVAVAGAMTQRLTPSGRGLEWVGAAGFAIGAATAAQDLAWFAAAMTAAVPVLAVAVLDSACRDRYGALAIVAALGATWAWLDVAGITVVEAYTLPATLAALILGELAWAKRPARSLATLGPALLLALGPSLAVAVGDDDVVRSVIVGCAALALVLVGARRRLQAPLVIGATALLVLAIDTLGPAASRLPRWVMLAIPGLILVWIGSNFERRREAVREATDRFAEFG